MSLKCLKLSKNQFCSIINVPCKKNRKVYLFLQNRAKAKSKRHPYSFLSYKDGSYTIEAAVLLPMFLVFSMLILFCMKVVYTEWKISTVLNRVADTAALYGEQTDEAWLYGSFYALALKENVPVDDIVGGLAGVTLFQSSVDDLRISLSADYIITYPISLLGKQGFYVSQRRTARIWNGYDPTQSKEEESIVYVTKYGTVYHTRLSCPHIDLSIRSISKDSLLKDRNLSGATYKKCPMCGKTDDTYYVTSWGDCYHSNLSCSGLKRTIYRMRLEEAEESYNACSKCGAGQ